MVGETAGKLLSHLSNKGSGLNPCQVLPVAGNGIMDVAFSPDGSKLAVACRDGACRLLDWPSGQCVAGFQVRTVRGLTATSVYMICAMVNSVHYHGLGVPVRMCANWM